MWRPQKGRGVTPCKRPLAPDNKKGSTMADPIRRLHGRMIRQHYRTMAGCACAAWCDGYNACRTDETARADKAEDRLCTALADIALYEALEDDQQEGLG